MGRAARNNVEEIIRRSAASIANGAGFRKANSEALNLLSLVLAQYMDNLCKYVQSFAEIGLRDKGSIVDVYQGFQYLGFDFADIHKYVQKGSRLALLPELSSADTLENEEKLFIADEFPYTYMMETTLHNAPSPPFPPLPPVHTYMSTPAIARNPSHEMPVGEEFVDINSRIRESLVRYVSKVIRISSTRNEDGTDSADTSTVAPQYVQQEGRSNATEGGTLSTSSAVSDGFTIDPSGNMLLNLEIGLFPVNYELSFGQNVRRKLS